MDEGYNPRLVGLLVFFIVMWLAAIYFGIWLYYPAFLSGMAMFVVGFLISILMSKGEFERRNEAGVQIFASYGHAALWKIARVLNGFLIFFGGVIVVLTYAAGILQSTID